MPRVLIVDDELEANRLLCRLLELKGCQTMAALTGAEAITMAEINPPDVIFLDLMLPDIDGLEICRRLKSGGPTAHTPVVIVTARLSRDSRPLTQAAGAADFIPKPYLPEQIFAALARALQIANLSHS